MAFEYLSSNSLAPVSGVNTLQGFFLPRPVVATINLSQLDTCVVEVYWFSAFAAGTAKVWTTGEFTANSSSGVLTPVMPVQWGVDLTMKLVSGPLGGNVFWDVFGL